MKTYLNEFEKRNMITQKVSHTGTVITIVKYNFYNDIFKKDTTAKYNSEYNSDYNSDYNKGNNIYKESNKESNKEDGAAAPQIGVWGVEVE